MHTPPPDHSKSQNSQKSQLWEQDVTEQGVGGCCKVSNFSRMKQCLNRFENEM